MFTAKTMQVQLVDAKQECTPRVLVRNQKYVEVDNQIQNIQYVTV